MASRIVASLFACAVIASSSAARAQSTPVETLAQSLFDEARNAMDAGRIDEACDKFARSQQLEPGGGTLLNLALCHDKQGKIATAWTEYNEALSLALKDGRQDRASFARESIDKLKDRLPRLAINVAPQPVQFVEVRLDGVTLPAAAIGVAAPVDPGAHVVEAGAYGRAPFRAQIAVGEGETRRVEVPVLGFPAPPPMSCPEGRTFREGRCVEVAKPDAPKGRWSTASWALAGVGAASIVTSAITGGLALAAHGDANKDCNLDRAYCATDAGYSAASRARTFAWVSTITLGVGVAAGAAAFFLPREPASQPKVGLALGPASAALVGSF